MQRKRCVFNAVSGVATTAIVSAVAVPALAITSDSFTYSTPRTAYLSLSPGAFSPESENVKYKKMAGVTSYIQDNSGLLSPSTLSCFSAGLNLPEGATIIEAVYVYGNNIVGSAQPAFGLYRQGLIDGSVQLLAALGAEPRTVERAYAHTLISPTVVRNGTNAYAAKVCLGFADIFYGARITYTYSNAGG